MTHNDKTSINHRTPEFRHEALKLAERIGFVEHYLEGILPEWVSCN
ncbi:hypothetical protein [unidentified bacterial endosymbiont]|nr:hypothetical protein [unidentified bacterial endosymbiont]